MKPTETRRSFVQKYLVLPLAAFIAACTGRSTPAPATVPDPAAPTGTTGDGAATSSATLLPTPACGDDDDEPTIAQTEGPYYTPDTPERTSFLEDGITGTRMVVTGQVLTTDCHPVAAALIDFWHCDDAGIYDNEGFRLRGHQFTDESGQYMLETIMPGLYPGRTRHFHVKVQAPDQPVLTTQLYFPDEPANAQDGIFDAALILLMSDSDNGKQGIFNFVLAL